MGASSERDPHIGQSVLESSVFPGQIEAALPQASHGSAGITPKDSNGYDIGIHLRFSRDMCLIPRAMLIFCRVLILKMFIFHLIYLGILYMESF